MTALGIVLAILKGLGWFILAVLLLMIVALFVPLGIALDWKAERLTVRALYGPFKITLYPRKPERASQPETPATKGYETPTEPPPKSEPIPKPAQTKVHTQDPVPSAASRQETVQPPPSSEETVAPVPPVPPTAPIPPEPPQPIRPETPPPKQEETDPLTALMQELEADPIAFLKKWLPKIKLVLGKLVRGIRVRHLNVFWTIHAEEANQTAILYGTAIAAANTLLAMAREIFEIQSDSLRLEPDFLGKLAEQRKIACEITTRPAILLGIAARILWAWFRREHTAAKPNHTTQNT